MTFFPFLLPLLFTPLNSLNLHHTPTHTFTLPPFCRTHHCQSRALQTLRASGCTHITPTPPFLHARCTPQALQIALLYPPLKSPTPFLSPRLRLLSPPLDSFLPYPPNSPAFSALLSQSSRFSKCSQSTGRAATIYIIDTGCRPTHTELFPRTTTLLPPGHLPFTTAHDAHGHGTHVAAIAAGTHIGVAKNAKLVCIRALDENNQGGAGVVARAVRMAVALHLRSKERLGVVSVSVGVKARANYKRLDRAMEHAARSGLIPVVAAGNAGGDACDFTPARASGVITVAAGGRRGLAEYSNWGSCVDIIARGSGIWSAHKDGDRGYARRSGTSMAAPFVSGVVALLLGNEGRIGVEAIRSRLRGMSKEEGYLGVKGYCEYEDQRRGTRGLGSRIGGKY